MKPIETIKTILLRVCVTQERLHYKQCIEKRDVIAEDSCVQTGRLE